MVLLPVYCPACTVHIACMLHGVVGWMLVCGVVGIYVVCLLCVWCVHVHCMYVTCIIECVLPVSSSAGAAEPNTKVVPYP